MKKRLFRKLPFELGFGLIILLALSLRMWYNHAHIQDLNSDNSSILLNYFKIVEITHRVVLELPI
ncbi:MAG: hypothetical protein ACRCVT_05075 [Leadbetterella sp.]